MSAERPLSVFAQPSSDSTETTQYRRQKALATAGTVDERKSSTRLSTPVVHRYCLVTSSFGAAALVIDISSAGSRASTFRKMTSLGGGGGVMCGTPTTVGTVPRESVDGDSKNNTSSSSSSDKQQRHRHHYGNNTSCDNRGYHDQQQQKASNSKRC